MNYRTKAIKEARKGYAESIDLLEAYNTWTESQPYGYIPIPMYEAPGYALFDIKPKLYQPRIDDIPYRYTSRYIELLDINPRSYSYLDTVAIEAIRRILVNRTGQATQPFDVGATIDEDTASDTIESDIVDEWPKLMLPKETSLVEKYSDEHMRLKGRGNRANYRDRIDLDDAGSISVGPACDRVYPFLHADPWEYSSPLESKELREMLASTTLAVLNDAEKFTTIVGEDTSGRIPALIIGKAINIVRERKGLPKARRVFVSGRTYNDVDPHYQAFGDDDKALLITEFISSGGSVAAASRALSRAGFKHVDVAAIDREVSFFDSVRLTDHRYYFGDYRTYTDRADKHLYRVDSRYKGVYKVSGEVHSRREDLLGPSDREALVRSRLDYDHFAEELVDIWTIFQENAVVQEQGNDTAED